MWARKRIDISLIDLLRAIVRNCLPCRRAESIRKISDYFGSHELLTCYSVRSGWYLFLESAQFSAGSEIIFTGLTIPDMPAIAARFGLNVVTVGIDWTNLSCHANEVESKITPQTKAIVVAHLFGGYRELTELAKIANRNEIFLIEDCAQCFPTGSNKGSQLADVSMFSFGPIKTNTSIGGAVLIVRDSCLRESMHRCESSWANQTRVDYVRRLVKFLLVKIASTWMFAALIRKAFLMIGSNHDAWAGHMGKSFSRNTDFARLRRRACFPLLATIAAQLKNHDQRTIQDRQERGSQLVHLIRSLRPDLHVVNFKCQSSTHWVFAVLVANQSRLVEHLWQSGFDATGRSSLFAVKHSLTGHASPNCKAILEHIVFLPIDPPMPAQEIERLAATVAIHAISLIEVHEEANTLDVRRSARPTCRAQSVKPTISQTARKLPKQ